ncbi:MAG TPA: hypothetical protein ENF22_02975 [Chloroflexi bacterium]|nr:hypothetical protein [Chloroflexota bacterium]
MNELWRDYSANQDNPNTVQEIDPQVAIDNGVVGFIFRAGSSWTYKDPTFNYLYPKVDGKAYWTSYFNFSPGADVDKQMDNWFSQHPKSIKGILPRFAANEINWNDLEPYQIAAEFFHFSNRYLEREGERPGIYTRKQLADLWLTPFLDADWLNEHWWWIAQYDANKYTEQLDRAIIPPNKVKLERCWLKQTASEIKGFPGEAESTFIDRNRFQFENMDEWIAENFGTPVPADSLESQIATLTGQIDGIVSLANTASLRAAEALSKYDTLSQGQVELVENGLKYEEWIEKTDKDLIHFVEQHTGEIKRLEQRIDGLAGGHSHPKWMRKLGLVID